jgi:hypothetical protein
MEILSLILTAAGGGVIGVVLNFLIRQRKTSHDGFKILEEAYQKQFEQLTKNQNQLLKEVGAWQSKYNDLEKKFDDLKQKLSLINQSYPDLPIPMWLKDSYGTMLSLNDAYERAFLSPKGYARIDYIGNSDDHIWGDKIGGVFRENDIKAISSGGEAIRIPEEDLTDPLLKKWNFVKYPKYVDGVLVGVGGIATPIKSVV